MPVYRTYPKEYFRLNKEESFVIPDISKQGPSVNLSMSQSVCECYSSKASNWPHATCHPAIHRATHLHVLSLNTLSAMVFIPPPSPISLILLQVSQEMKHSHLLIESDFFIPLE